MSKANRTFAGHFEPKNELQTTALFGNDRQAQKEAHKRLRANSGLSAADWDRLDKAVARGRFGATNNAVARNTPSANAQTLDYEEWEDRDDMLLPETQQVLTAVDDLVQAGFTVDTSLARFTSVYEETNEFDDVAERSMDGRARGTEDSTVVEIDGVPLPIVHVDYEISAREQQNSQNFGESLDTQDAEKAARQVRENLEDLLFNGWGVNIETNRGTLDVTGYTTEPSRLTDTAAGDWGTPSNVLDTVDNMENQLREQGPNDNEGYMPEQEGLWIYVPTAQWGELSQAEDPRGDGNMTLLERVNQNRPYIEFRHAGELDAGTIVGVIQNRNVVDLADAQAITNMSWDVEGGMATRYKTLACRVPRVKSTFEGRSGIIEITGA